MIAPVSQRLRWKFSRSWANAHTNAYAYTYTYTYPNANPDAYTNTYADCNAYTYAHSDTGADHAARAWLQNTRLQKVDLFWSGPTSGFIDIYRNGVLIATVPNEVDSIPITSTALGREPIRIGCA
jgi:hypothetical protein